MADQVQTVQTRRNFYTNILTLVVNIVVGFFYTPYLTRTLGPSAYGIVPLALIINQYISVVASALTSSFTRFYSVAIVKFIILLLFSSLFISTIDSKYPNIGSQKQILLYQLKKVSNFIVKNPVFS